MSLSEPAKMLLLGSLLAKQRIISNNAKAFLKEMILRRDPRLARVLAQFEDKTANDAEFLENIHELIRTYPRWPILDLLSMIPLLLCFET